MKQPIHLWDARHPKEREAFLYIPLLALGLTLISELFNHKAFTDGPSSFWQFVTENPIAFLVNVFLVLVTLAPAFFFRRRMFWCALVSVVWLMGGAVNGFILLNRMTPFTVADLTVFQTGIDTLPNYLSTPYIILLVEMCIRDRPITSRRSGRETSSPPGVQTGAGESASRPRRWAVSVCTSGTP